MAARRLFITGTDTEIGKTYVSCALIHALRGSGRRVAPMKPVASGCENMGGALRNDDAVALLEASGLDLPYGLVNPYAFEPPIAPHIAAAETGQEIDPEHIVATCGALEARTGSDLTLIEGVGGWCVPLSPAAMLVDLVRALQAEVILVVGMRLGCLNHAMLSARQVVADGVRLRGWVANQIDPQQAVQTQNLQWLEEHLDAPCLGRVPFGMPPQRLRGGSIFQPSSALADAAAVLPLSSVRADALRADELR